MGIIYTMKHLVALFSRVGVLCRGISALEVSLGLRRQNVVVDRPNVFVRSPNMAFALQIGIHEGCTLN